MGKKSVLFVAPMTSEFQLAMWRGMEALGWDVHPFDWTVHASAGAWGAVQATYVFGPDLARANKRLVNECQALRPDVVYVYKGIYMSRRALEKIKKCARLAVSYNPDNPFGNFTSSYARRYRVEGDVVMTLLRRLGKRLHFARLWTRFIDTIPLYDLNFVPRQAQVAAYMGAGAKDVRVLRWYYIPEVHRPVPLSARDRARYEADVSFIGRYEPDQRRECIEALIDAGMQVRLFGTGWQHYLSPRMRDYFGDAIRPVYGTEYAKAICASKCVLNFNAKLNEDTSTIRCVEIPACGSVLVSERSDELRSWFAEGEEAVFFTDRGDLVDRVRVLLAEPERRSAIAERGRVRCLADGHDVYTRMKEWDSVVTARLGGL